MEFALIAAIVAVHFLVEVVLGNAPSCAPAMEPCPAAAPSRLSPHEFATRLLPLILLPLAGLWLAG